MVLLSAFALLAGAGTALSPCVLPVLPALLFPPAPVLPARAFPPAPVLPALPK